MAEVKGKFITMAASFLRSKPELQEIVYNAVQNATGHRPPDLEPEEWYATSALDTVFQTVRLHQEEFDAWVTLKVMGQEVYYTIKYSGGIPPHVNTPLEMIKFEAEGFLANHRGDDVQPRRILQAQDRHVVMEAPSPGYDCAFIEGVYEGILRMNGIYESKVTQSQCIKNGDATCVYDIKW
jgi:hypothetical protein